MTDAGPPQDRLVRTALELLPVPDHGPDFWHRLGAALDAEMGVAVTAPVAPAAVVAPPSPPALANPRAEATRGDATDPGLVLQPEPEPVLVPLALRRTSNAVLVAVAAAAVVVVALAGASLLDSRQGTTVTANRPLTPSASLDALVQSAQAEPGTPTTMSADGQEASMAAVLTWVDDLRTGRGEEAWSALGTASRAHFGTQSDFEQQLADLAADFAMEAGVAEPEQIMVTPVHTDDEGTIAIVTFVHTVTGDGQAGHRAHAIPVRVVDGVVHLEPFVSAGWVEMVVPRPVDPDGAVEMVTPETELVVVVPSDARPPVLRIDDAPPMVCGEAAGTELIVLAEGAGQRCAYEPDGGLEPGEHTLTVGFVDADATSISASCVLFAAA